MDGEDSLLGLVCVVGSARDVTSFFVTCSNEAAEDTSHASVLSTLSYMLFTAQQYTLQWNIAYQFGIIHEIGLSFKQYFCTDSVLQHRFSLEAFRNI